jgi:hypothetical protein
LGPLCLHGQPLKVQKANALQGLEVQVLGVDDLDIVGLQVKALVLQLHLVAAKIHHQDLRRCEEDDLLGGELRKHHGMNLAKILGVAQFEGLEEFGRPDLRVPENLELLLFPEDQPKVGELITMMLVGCVHIH